MQAGTEGRYPDVMQVLNWICSICSVVELVPTLVLDLVISGCRTQVIPSCFVSSPVLFCPRILLPLRLVAPSLRLSAFVRLFCHTHHPLVLLRNLMEDPFSVYTLSSVSPISQHTFTTAHDEQSRKPRRSPRSPNFVGIVFLVNAFKSRIQSKHQVVSLRLSIYLHARELSLRLGSHNLGAISLSERSWELVSVVGRTLLRFDSVFLPII